MFAAIAALLLAAAPLQDSAHVVLVATAGVQGHATGWDYAAGRASPGGLGRVAAVAESLRARYPGQVVLVDAGDVLAGDPLATYLARVAPATPHPLVEAMNLAGYDAATPGERDFEWGAPFFLRATADARFGYVSANLLAGTGDSLLFPPYRVVQRQGVRIAIAGVTTEHARSAGPTLASGGPSRISLAPITDAAVPALEGMRRDADVAVLLVHTALGRAQEDTAAGEDPSFEAIARLPLAPDVVVAGHAGRELRDSVIVGTHVVAPGAYGRSVSVVHLDLVRDRGRWRIARVRTELVPTDSRAPSTLLAQRLAPVDAATRAWAATPIGLASAPMRAAAARVQPEPLVEFVNAVERRRANADLAATSIADLRAAFDADTIRVADVLSLYPFDYTLRAVRVSGADLKRYLEWSARYYQVDPAGRVRLNDSVPGADFDVVSGAQYEIDLRQPVGERIQRLTVRGRPVAPTDSFSLALSSARQQGAGGYVMLRGAPVVYDKGERIAELLLEAVRAESPLDPASHASRDWRIVPEVADRAVRGLFGVPAPPLPRAARDTVVLRVLATGDLHGAFLATGAALAGTLDSLAAECDCPTLRVDAGDAMQGTIVQSETRGRAGMELLGRLGYAAAALGDHDFDWSLETLRARAGESAYPWLAANVLDSATGRRPDWIAPFRLVEVAGMPVAIVGYLTPETTRLLPPDRTRGLRIGEGELALHDVLTELGRRRPALTILLAHAGAACDSLVCTGEVVRLAEQLGGRGVSLIVAGHTHRTVTARVAGIPILETGARGESVGVADLVKTPAGGLEFRVGVVPVDPARAGGDARFRAALDAYERRSDSIVSRPLAQLKRPLVRDGAQYPLGGLLAEARRNALRADIGLIRTEAIRADLPAGAVTYARLTAVEPGSADLVRLTLSGAQVAAVMEQALAGGAPTVHLAGAQVRFDPRAPAGRRVKAIVLEGGRKLRPDGEVSVATDEATAQGAGGLAPLAGVRYERGGLLDVEADAMLLRRLAQPVEVAAPTGFLSTRP